MKLSEEIDEWMDEDQGECITPPLLKWMMSAEALEKENLALRNCQNCKYNIISDNYGDTLYENTCGCCASYSSWEMKEDE